jgi:mRNA-degrading endonuclease toxin of MazEF toxin-antitoxin module
MVLSSAETALAICQNSLQGYLDDVASTEPTDLNKVKTCADYFSWVSFKTELLRCEDIFILPSKIIPNKITQHEYNYLRSDKRIIVDKYYKLDRSTGKFIINAKKTTIHQTEAETLIHSLVLKRGNVVWVNFGFNIGNEFRGKHPAIILKNTKSVMVVIPLSSQPPSKPEINVEVKTVNGLPSSRLRWANIFRIVPVSVLRIDFNSPIGDVKGVVLNEISAKISLHGIK